MSTKELILGTAGIYAAYLTLSLVNERLFTHEYINVDSKLGDEFQKDKYKFPDLSVCVSSLFCALFSYFRAKIQKDPKNPIPVKEYFILGALYTINILAASYALLYISYPVRVVSDKCGYLTAVVVGVYFSRIKKSDVKLESKKVLIAIIITAGAVLFAITRQQQASKAWQLVYNPDTMWIGYLLMFISISGQALFTDSQAFCKITYKPTINHLMFTVNLMTSIICFVSILLKGDLIDSIMFCKSHPFAIIDVGLIGLLQVLGQISIYFIVLNFKQHIFPLVSTTRKVFTVLLSIFFFNHKMNIYQWFALVFVFGGMGYQLVDELYSDLTHKKKKSLRSDSKKLSEISAGEQSEKQKQVSQITEKTVSEKQLPTVQQITITEKPVQGQEEQDKWYNHLKMQPQDYLIDQEQAQGDEQKSNNLNEQQLTSENSRKKGKKRENLSPDINGVSQKKKLQQNLVFQNKSTVISNKKED